MALSCYFTDYFTDYFATCPPGGSGSADTFLEIQRQRRLRARLQTERDKRNLRVAQLRDFEGRARNARERWRAAILTERALRAERAALPAIVPLPRRRKSAPVDQRSERAIVLDRQIVAAHTHSLQERIRHRRIRVAADRARRVYQAALKRIDEEDEAAARDFLLWLMMDED